MCIRGKDCIPLLKQTTKLVQGPASSVTIASTYRYLQETLENKEASGGCNHARSTLYRQATRDLYPNRCHANIFSISMQQLNVHGAAALLQPRLCSSLSKLLHCRRRGTQTRHIMEWWRWICCKSHPEGIISACGEVNLQIRTIGWGGRSIVRIQEISKRQRER